MTAMTDVKPPETQDLSAENVLTFLMQNPNFLVENAEILSGQGVETKKDPKAGRVVDFQKILVEKLKADKSKVEGQTRDVIEAARTNMQVQTRTHATILRLLEADSFESFIDIITAELGILLDVDLVMILLENKQGTPVPHLDIPGIRLIDEGLIDHYLNGEAIRLENDCMGQERIFGGGAGLVRSQAFIRLDISPQAPQGMLAFGSRDPNLFQEGQSTDCLSFLAMTIAGLARLWLGLPRV